MKTAAAAAGEVPSFKCGPREIVKLIVEAQELQKKRHDCSMQEKWVLALEAGFSSWEYSAW